MDRDELIAFEKEVAAAFAQKRCKGPVHLSGGNEAQLIEIFKDIDREDWVFSTYRSHYHALLHGIPRDWLMQQILDGHSMNIMSPEHRFFTSAIVGGCLPIAVGVAAALKRQGSERKVSCFVGDMTWTTGAFQDAADYAAGHELSINFVVEDNGMSCDTPTMVAWGDTKLAELTTVSIYKYTRTYPHVGLGYNVF